MRQRLAGWFYVLIGTLGSSLAPAAEKEQLEEIQRQISTQLRRVGPTVVCIEAGGGSGSGVIVSPDGLILTAAHVIDKATDITIVYPDGQRFRGKALGTYGPADAGMAQIVEGGSHPFSEVAPAGSLAVGQTAFAMGHPSGFDQSRGAPIRIGHITQINENFFSLDAPLVGGDSGGPSFDLQGRVIGIHSHISGQVEVNRDSNIDAFHTAWQMMKAGQHSEMHYSQAVGGMPDESGDEVPEQADQAAKSDVEAQARTNRLQELIEQSKANGSKLKIDREELQRLRQQIATQTDTLASAAGGRIRDAWSAIWQTALNGHCERLQVSVRKVFVGGRQSALASAVSSDGLFVTKASEVKNREIKLELQPRLMVSAELVAVNDELDLALIKVKSNQSITPLPLQDVHLRFEKGALCAAVGSSSEPAGFGIASVANRPLNGKSGAFLGVKVQPTQGGVMVIEIKPGSPAIAAGLRPDDVLLAADEVNLLTADQLAEVVERHVPGDVLRLHVTRGPTQLSLQVTLKDGVHLAPMAGSREQGHDSVAAKLSKRRWFFSCGIQHDCCIASKDCGGPLIDLDGKIVGINIARAGRVQSYAIPIAEVIKFIEPHIAEQVSK